MCILAAFKKYIGIQLACYYKTTLLSYMPEEIALEFVVGNSLFRKMSLVSIANVEYK